MTAQEYADWRAEYETSPWGEMRQDMGTATIAATIANVHRGADSPAFSPLDFAPFVAAQMPPAPAADPADDVAAFFATAHHGR